MFDSMINNIENKLNEELKEYHIKEAMMLNLKKNKDEEEEKLKKLELEIDNLKKVKILLQKTSQFAREQSKKQMEYLITQCLQYIFDSKMEFFIDIKEKGEKIEAEFYVISEQNNNKIITKPQDSRGGGVVDIISLAIRIAMMEIHYPKIEGPLILDEPAKHVSDDYIVNVAEFLKNVSSMFNRQIIMVTHNSHLLESGDYVYRVTLNNGISMAEKIKGDIK
ncbi:ATPase [Caloramator sp. CAR-1]|uniref:ATPase n=2 Tax=unclassified Caloramator TaxID=2629145 RepID=UPI0026E2A3DF|nr:ATPase [Caloramator sp. CAR-1]MDO6355454.1 ATPase [Caloramator sp. CAR-1]